MSNWMHVTNALPPLDRVVELVVVSGYDGSLCRAFGCRIDQGEGWLWALASYGGSVPTDAGDCDADDDYHVWAWREPTPLPDAAPKGWNGSPNVIDPTPREHVHNEDCCHGSGPDAFLDCGEP